MLDAIKKGEPVEDRRGPMSVVKVMGWTNERHCSVRILVEINCDSWCHMHFPCTHCIMSHINQVPRYLDSHSRWTRTLLHTHASWHVPVYKAADYVCACKFGMNDPDDHLSLSSF